MERDGQVGTRAVVGPAGDAWGTQGETVFKLLGAPAGLSYLLGKPPALLWHVKSSTTGMLGLLSPFRCPCCVFQEILLPNFE